jgi:radical SAM protein with 4Fe4S-binding SPASM domain
LETNPDIKERLRRIATFSTSRNPYEPVRRNLLSPFEEEKISLTATGVEKMSGGDSIRPVIARIYLSSRCAHNCSGCSFAYLQNRNGIFLNPSYFRKLVDDLYSMHIQLIDLTGGGEPTLHPQFIEFVKMCREREFQLALLSNGTWDDLRLFDLLAEGFSFIRVSLDASSGEVYERFHRPSRGGEFQRMMNNLEKLISEREKRKSGLVIGAKVKLSQANMNYVEGMITLTKDLGLDYIQFHIKPCGGEALLPDQRRNVHEILSELRNKHHPLLVYAGGEEEKSENWCWSSMAQLTIDASGNVYSCPHFPDQMDAARLGNFFDLNINDLWLDYNLKCGFSSANMGTCSVENCRWRFYDSVIRQRITQ